jgi:hypothetical protein
VPLTDVSKALVVRLTEVVNQDLFSPTVLPLIGDVLGLGVLDDKGVPDDDGVTLAPAGEDPAGLLGCGLPGGLF